MAEAPLDCLSCPCLLLGDPSAKPATPALCRLAPKPEPIKNPSGHVCSHHPEFWDRAKKAKLASQLSSRPLAPTAGINPTAPYDCTCLSVGKPHMAGTLMNTFTYELGIQVSAFRNCAACHGTGVIQPPAPAPPAEEEEDGQ